MTVIPDRETLLQMAWENMELAEGADHTSSLLYNARARNLMLMATQFIAPDQVRQQAEIHAEVSTTAALKAAATSQERVVVLLEILQAFMEAVDDCTAPSTDPNYRRFIAPYERGAKLVNELIQEANHVD